MSRVLVCGGRNFSDQALVDATLTRLMKVRGIDVLIEGNARGADRMAGFWARRNRVTNLKFNADWDTHGNKAGLIRNQRMLDEGRPDLVIAFPGGRGTADMVRRAKAAGIEVVEVAA